jgi:hypothetical protein
MSDPVADPKEAMHKLLRSVEGFSAQQLELLAAAIRNSPETAFRRLLALLSVGPTPRFAQPPVPCSVTVANVTRNGLTVSFSVNVYYTGKYTLLVYFNEAASPITPIISLNGNPVPNTAIDIPLAGSGNLLIDGAIFGANGAGEYLLKLTANNYTSGLGYGITCTDVVVTAS